MNLPDDIDPGIRPVVELLNCNGLRTTSSCQGGEGHAWEKPTVRIAPVMTQQGLSLDMAEHMLVGVLILKHYSGFSIKRVQHYQNALRPWKPAEMSYVEVEFWSDWEDLPAHE